jgi:hypothetical protein
MADTRELILLRLKAISITLPGILNVFRNRGLLTTDKRPCIAILDGDESVALAPPKSGRGGTIVGPQLNRMTPEIYLCLPEARPTNDTPGGGIGPDLDAFRIAASTAILGDDALKALLGSNGSIAPLGAVTDLKSGSPVAGQMRLDFAFIYLYDPRNL